MLIFLLGVSGKPPHPQTTMIFPDQPCHRAYAWTFEPEQPSPKWKALTQGTVKACGSGSFDWPIVFQRRGCAGPRARALCAQHLVVTATALFRLT